MAPKPGAGEGWNLGQTGRAFFLVAWWCILGAQRVFLVNILIIDERGGPPHGLKGEQNLGPQEIWKADQIYTYWLRYGDIKEFVLSRDTRFLSYN